MKFETLAVHAGREVDPATNAVAPPIYLSTTFERAADGSFPPGYAYARENNPNRAALETSLAALEGGAVCAAFASGNAATYSILQGLAPGDQVILSKDVFYGTGVILREVLAKWGLQASFVNMTDLGEVEQAITPNTKIIWVETPSNPLLTINDIKALAGLAHSAGALCVCDNTWATSLLQRPLELGADLVMHSTTKYIGGHSDVLSGAVIAKNKDEFFARIRHFQKAGGAIPSPFDCWLLLRSIPSFPLRVRAQAETAHRVAYFLSEHPKVAALHYPGLKSHPGHDMAAKQMSLFGGMLSFEIFGGRAEAFAVTAKLQLLTRATSLGSIESLIEHRASIEGVHTRAPESLLRVSIGLEHADDLIADLEQALQ